MTKIIDTISSPQALGQTTRVHPNANQSDFASTFKDAVEQIDGLQHDAVRMGEMFVNGEMTDLHQVMLAAEKAKLGLELMLEVRNKLLEGYQEIMRMQM